MGRYPVPFIALPIIVFGGLGLGLLAMDPETDLERVYFPLNSRAVEDRQTVRDTFPDLSRQAYNSFSQSDLGRSRVPHVFLEERRQCAELHRPSRDLRHRRPGQSHQRRCIRLDDDSQRHVRHVRVPVCHRWRVCIDVFLSGGVGSGVGHLPVLVSLGYEGGTYPAPCPQSSFAQEF